MLKIGSVIKNIRRVNSLTQEQLGRLLGRSRVQINQYENEKNLPSIEILHKLCKHFDISADSVLDGTLDYSIINSNSIVEESSAAYIQEKETLIQEKEILIQDLRHTLDLQKKYIEKLEADKKGYTED